MKVKHIAASILLLIGAIFTGVILTRVYKQEEVIEQPNLVITYKLPDEVKSISVKVQDNEEEHKAYLIHGLKFNESTQITMKEDEKCSFKITVNLKDGYSVSEEFTEDFNYISKKYYEVVVEKNEVVIKKVQVS
ncbi:hypothetical protein [Clostridium sp. Marseille-P299]|uniref:hypothetical protein n=1 Tax=Clostridium sp. Marseille-P299 TaxID=1805477 RepID=UPI00082D76EA|nr:hypothetical protein [Clostridium sp. Marseille-P299]